MFGGIQQPRFAGVQQPMYAQQPFMPQQQGMGMMSQARNAFGVQQPQAQMPQVVTIGGQQYQVVNIPDNQMQRFQ